MVADNIQRCDTRKHNVRLISLVSTRAQYEILDDKDDVKVWKRIVSAIGELKRGQKKGSDCIYFKNNRLYPPPDSKLDSSSQKEFGVNSP